MELRIRRFESADLEPLYALLSDAEVMRYIEPPYTREAANQFLEKAGLSDVPLIYAVEDADKLFVGYVIYHDAGEDSKEIGWLLKKEFWGRGYAQALTKTLIEKAISEQKSVLIECAPEQAVTKHIAKKSGFCYIGQADGCDVYRLAYDKEKRRGCL